MSEDILVGGRQQSVWRSYVAQVFLCGCKMLSVSLRTVFILEDVILRWLLQGPLLKDFIPSSWGEAQPHCFP